MARSRGSKPVIGSKAIKPKVYPLMVEAVEAGAAYGWHRAHKHGEPTDADAIDVISQAVMSEISDRFSFDVLGDE